jgi:hypothetical protein
MAVCATISGCVGEVDALTAPAARRAVDGDSLQGATTPSRRPKWTTSWCARYAMPDLLIRARAWPVALVVADR